MQPVAGFGSTGITGQAGHAVMSAGAAVVGGATVAGRAVGNVGKGAGKGALSAFGKVKACFYDPLCSSMQSMFEGTVGNVGKGADKGALSLWQGESIFWMIDNDRSSLANCL